MTELNSDRLRLIAATTAMLDAEDVSSRALASLLRLQEPQEWPPEHNGPETRAWVRGMISEHLADPDWFTWYVITIDKPALIGIAGYKGPPAQEGHVEVGYSVLPAFQRRGLATEATRLLCNRAFADPRVSRVIAHTLPSLPASQRVLDKVGFVKTAELQDPDEGAVWRYELSR